MQSNASASTSSRAPAPPKAPHQLSVSPPTSSLGTPYVDRLYSHPSDAFGQPAPPADILPPSQNFAYAHLPTHSDELARVPVGHVFQPADTWLTPAQHPHRHQPHAQQLPHAAHVRTAVPMYAAAHQPTSYGPAPGTDSYSAFVASLDPTAVQQGQGQGQDSGIDMWQTVPTGYEFVFPFPPGAGHGSALAPCGSWV